MVLPLSALVQPTEINRYFGQSVFCRLFLGKNKDIICHDIFFSCPKLLQTLISRENDLLWDVYLYQFYIPDNMDSKSI
jgi:hypothetical protein